MVSIFIKRNPNHYWIDVKYFDRKGSEGIIFQGNKGNLTTSEAALCPLCLCTPLWGKQPRTIQGSSVSDPYHFDTDPTGSGSETLQGSVTGEENINV